MIAFEREREGEVLKGGRESRSNPVRLKPLHTFLLSVHRVLLKIDRLPDSSLTNPPKMNSFCHSQSCHFALKRDEESNCSHIGVFCVSFHHDVLETKGLAETNVLDMPPQSFIIFVATVHEKVTVWDHFQRNKHTVAGLVR